MGSNEDRYVPPVQVKCSVSVEGADFMGSSAGKEKGSEIVMVPGSQLKLKGI